MSVKMISASIASIVMGLAMAQNAPDGDARKEQNRIDLAARFKQLDKNGDGKLTLDELTAGFSSVPLGRRPAGPDTGATEPSEKLSQPTMSVGEFLKAADSNNDGVLSVDEFASMVEKVRESGRSGGGMGGGMGGA
jgi:Ca2+-binding EF-hand superfamily protein